MSTPNLDAHTDTCRTCRAPIVWATTRNGTPMPVNATPHERGNVLLNEHQGRLYAGVLGRNTASGARAAGRTLYLSHHVDCPHADQHRKTRA